MALKDLKSDLSKFRMPKKEPLEGKARVDVNKNQNLTPLDSLANGLPNPSKPNKTTDKRGVDVSRTNQTPITPDYDGYYKETPSGSPKIETVTKIEPFKGETTPKKVDNSEKFKGETSVEPMNRKSKFLGETSPTPMDNSEKFKGETTPTEINQTEKFKGETSPTPMDNSEKFKGETTPTRDNSTPVSPNWEGYYTKQIPNATDTSKIKQGDKFKGETDPNVVQQGDKFKGETSVEPMNLEEKFKGETEPTEIKQGDKFKGETDTKPMSLEEKFLGETNPTPMSLEERFLGETDPNKMDNSEKFLGETNPTPMDNSEKFLGETTPKSENNTGQFLGETAPTPMSLDAKFLGETDPNVVQQGDKFKGETDATKFDNTSNFVRFSNEQISSPFATEPNKMNLDAKFLGETNPNIVQQGDKFKGETEPTDKDSTGQFLGETTPTEVEQGDKFKGEVNPTVMSLGDKFKGETTPDRFPYILRQENEGKDPTNFPYIFRQENEGKDPGKVNYIEDLHANGFTSNMYPIGGPKKSSQFIGVDPSQTQFDGATSLYGKLGLTNFIVDDDATGFTKDMFPIGSSKKPSQFTGVDSAGTVFDEKSSEYSNTKSLYNGLSYRPGYGKFKFDKETGNVQRYSESNKYLIDNELTRLGISQLQEMRSSPSFLDEMYHKFNLRDDAFNLGTAAFAHPLILRGIQRKKIDKGEPQKWGFGFPIDDGLVRGGIVTALDRAVVDAVRLGKWMVSVQGLLWGIKQLGLQQSTANVESITGKRKTKIWTPINTLATTLGGFAGLHPNRHGITPFDSNEGTYSEVLDEKRNAHTDDKKLANGPKSNRLVNRWNKEFEQLPNGDVKDKGDGSKLLDKLKNAFSGGPNSLYGLGDFAPNQSTENTIPDAQLGELGRTYNQKKQYNPTAAGPNPSGKKGDAFEPNNTELGLNANNLPGSFLNNTIKTDTESHPIEKNYTAGEVIKNYETIAYGNIPTREAGNPSIIDFRSLLTDGGAERLRADNEFTDYPNKHIHTRVGFATYEPGRDLTNHSEGITADPITSAPVGSNDVNDLVHFWVTEEGGGNRCQFRGTITGLTDTFSPSWDSVKYAGRADQGYKYGTFERSVSFNFQAYATSRADMIPMWKKLQMLSTMTMPEYVSQGYNGTLVRFKLGSLYNDKLSFIDSLTYTISDDVPWDINIDGLLGEVPMGIDVAIGFKVLDDTRPEYTAAGTAIYDWTQIQ